ncbi:hypothetical protein [Actinoplanes sp. URMC 104]|uniref:hypothetical protein n=1 Tax=Actinoplanes sp. URMC 104 TaxID=3423409 RepID=UPI003F1C8097
MTRDWVQWHEEYDVPGSSLARRLEVVRGHLRHLLAGPRRVIGMCAGDGRDVARDPDEFRSGVRLFRFV